MAILKHMLSAKIHKATITDLELSYQGSIGIDKKLLLKSGIVPGEKVQVLNFSNGERFETYVIEERENSGKIAFYGPAARRGELGDKICIISYVMTDENEVKKVKQKVVFVDEQNRIID